MGDINSQMDVKETTKVMQEFTKQNEHMNIKEDMLDDALMDAVSVCYMCVMRWGTRNPVCCIHREPHTNPACLLGTNDDMLMSDPVSSSFDKV